MSTVPQEWKEAHVSRYIDQRMRVSLHRLIAPGRVRGELTTRAHRDISRLLHRLDRAIFGRLHDDRPRATDPRHNRGPVFVIMTPPGLTFLAAPTRATPQRLLPTLLGLPLLASGVGESIGFDGPFQLPLHFIGQGRIPEPPAPPITGADMDSHLSRHAPGRTGKAPQKGGEDPVPQQPLALVQQGLREVV